MIRKNLLLDLFLTFFKIGAFTFGGGYAMVSLLDVECVEKKKWLTTDELMQTTIIAESTPGPIAINCATYTGYKVHGLIGAIIATLGIILPSTVIIYFISIFFEDLLENPLIFNIFRGIRVAVSLLIIQAALRMAKKILKTAKKKIVPLLFISSSFLIVLFCNIVKIHFSTIYFLIISGIIGYFVYNQKEKGVKS